MSLALIATNALAGALPPFIGNRLRSRLLKAAGLKIGKGSIFWGMPTIIGTNVTKNLTIGEECGFNVGCVIDVGGQIKIGNHVGCGHHVMILSRTYALGSAAQRAGMPLCDPVVIEDGVWISARCTIMPGVTIGAGAVIGATMVISKDVPSNTLLLGPQKISLAKWRA
jgi:maltose O-acetyltransferase